MRKTPAINVEIVRQGLRYLDHIVKDLDSMKTPRPNHQQKVVLYSAGKIPSRNNQKNPRKLDHSDGGILTHDPQPGEQAPQHKPGDAPICSNAICGKPGQVKLLLEIGAPHRKNGLDRGVSPNRRDRVEVRDEFCPLVSVAAVLWHSFQFLWFTLPVF